MLVDIALNYFQKCLFLPASIPKVGKPFHLWRISTLFQDERNEILIFLAEHKFISNLVPEKELAIGLNLILVDISLPEVDRVWRLKRNKKGGKPTEYPGNCTYCQRDERRP